METGQKLISGQGWSIVGKRIAANSCSASIFNAVKEIMPRVLLSNLEKVTRMTCFGEVFYSADYGKLKTCGYCVEYGNDGLFGLVQYFLYSPSLGNAVAVIHPLKQLDSVFQTLWLDNNCSHHIQEVVQDNRYIKILFDHHFILKSFSLKIICTFIKHRQNMVELHVLDWNIFTWCKISKL